MMSACVVQYASAGHKKWGKIQKHDLSSPKINTIEIKIIKTKIAQNF